MGVVDLSCQVGQPIQSGRIVLQLGCNSCPAGFHPLEVLKSATLNGAELLGIDGDTGSIQVGKKADLVILDENPLANFKLLYGTGHRRLNREAGRMETVGGDFVEVLRRRLNGVSNQEIAEQMGISVNTVYTRADRGKKALKDCIERKLQ